MKKNTIKKLILLFFVIVLIFIFPSLFSRRGKTGDPGTSSSPRLDDGANLLSIAARENVLASLDYYSEKYQTDFVIVTVQSTGSKTDVEYADDYYDYHDYYENGALLLIVVDTGSRYISTKGSCESAIDPSLDRFRDEVSTYLKQHRYEDGLLRYASLCGECMKSYRNTGIGIGVVFVLAFGLVAAIVVTSVMRGKLKTVYKKVEASDYTTKDSLNLTKKQDIFLYHTVTRTAKPKSSSSSGGHYSSSGSHHGGGHI